MVRYTYDINGILVVDLNVASKGKSYTKVLSENLSGEELEARMKELDQMRADPASLPENAELIEKLYSIRFSHPAVEQIIYWNMVDGYAHLWNPSPEKIAASRGDMTIGENVYYGGLLRYDMTPKPAYFAIRNLFEKVWHTETAVQTDGDGKLCFRGFYGDYELEMTHNGQTVTKEISLTKKGENSFKIVVEE